MKKVFLSNRVKVTAGVLLGIQLLSTNFVWADEQKTKPSERQPQEQDFVYEDHGKRDPFWSLVSSTGAIINYDNDILISDMILEGIIAGTDGKNLAIINSTIVKPNDKVGPFVVEKIEANKVFLRKEQESFELKIKKEE